MSEKYQIIFQGQVRDGFDLSTVKQRMAKLFKSDLAQIEKLFSGQRLVLKDNLPLEMAEKYKNAIIQQGAICELKKKTANPAPVATPNPGSGQAQKQLNIGGNPATAAHHSVAQNKPANSTSMPSGQAPQTRPASGQHEEGSDQNSWHKGIDQFHTGSLHDTSIAPAGIQLVEIETVPDLEIDIHNLSMADAGETIVEPSKVEEPDINIDGLSIVDPDKP